MESRPLGATAADAEAGITHESPPRCAGTEEDYFMHLIAEASTKRTAPRRGTPNILRLGTKRQYLLNDLGTSLDSILFGRKRTRAAFDLARSVLLTRRIVL